MLRTSKPTSSLKDRPRRGDAPCRARVLLHVPKLKDGLRAGDVRINRLAGEQFGRPGSTAAATTSALFPTNRI